MKTAIIHNSDIGMLSRIKKCAILETKQVKTTKRTKTEDKKSLKVDQTRLTTLEASFTNWQTDGMN